MNLLRKLGVCALAGSLYLTTSMLNSYANDMFIGVRGPTNWQLDVRATYSENEKNIETITNNLMLKYWDGNKLGKWFFVSVPYKFVDSLQGSNKGIGDITIGLGPRGRINYIHWFLYGALMLPTGASEEKVPLGNGRLDIRTGVFATYLTGSKNFEIDGSLEYNFTGENRKNINPPNELSLGLLAGGKITEKIRFATGLTDLIKENGNFLLNSRSVLRYTVSKGLHFELVIDKSIYKDSIPNGTSIGVFARYNF